MTSGKSDKVDDGVGSFGGEKLRQHEAAANTLPDEHANSTGHESRDETIVASEFSGLDNDLIDMSNFGEGRPDTDQPSDPSGLPEEDRTDTANQSVSQYDRPKGN